MKLGIPNYITKRMLPESPRRRALIKYGAEGPAPSIGRVEDALCTATASLLTPAALPRRHDPRRIYDLQAASGHFAAIWAKLK